MKILLISSRLIFLLAIFFVSNIYAQIAEWKTYTDPDKGFTIDYPSDWKVQPNENRFETGDVDFIKKETTILSDGTLIEENTVIVGIIFGRDLGMDAIDPKDFANALSDRNKFTFNKYREIEKNIDRYTIDGKPLYGFIAAHYDSTGLSEQAQLQLVSFPEGNLFGFLYMTGVEEFEKYLPIVEKMVESINIPVIGQ